MKLRQYQLDTVDGARNAWDIGHRNVCIVLPTGAGKTHTKSFLTKVLDVPTMAIAHRQELILQISMSLASFGIQHKVIAPDVVVRMITAQHIKKFGQAYTHGREVMVSSVQTLVRRQESLQHLFGRIKLWDIDECFPAGTLVDGKPIEMLKVGDVVTSFNETTGRFEPKPITAVMRNPMPQLMVRIKTAHHVLTSTPSHPIWTKRGWIEAGKLRDGDEVLHVRGGCGPQTSDDEILQKVGASLLRSDVQRQVSVPSVKRDNGTDEPQVCVGTHEAQESDALRGVARKDARHALEDQTPADSQGRQWKTTDIGRTDAGGSIGDDWFQEPTHRPGGSGSRTGLADTLQHRLRAPDVENSHRSGRVQSYRNSATGVGQAQGQVSDWTRVESVTFLERSDIDRDGNGHVYNIEVDGNHTYVAGGLTVHNCHHCLPDNMWGKAIQLFPNAKGLGVTATPLRCDGKGLDGVFDKMIVGPSMRDLIGMGFLTDYRIFCPPVSIRRDKVRTSASSGEFVRADLIEETHKSSIVGDVVNHYLRIAAGQRGITFAVDLKSARDITDAFLAQGVPAQYVDADTPDRERVAASEAFARGDIKQMVNVDLFGEGYDVPACSVASMARPTQSYGLFVQQFGRALRPDPASGKTHATIIDHVGNVVSHGLPDAPRMWSLEGRKKRNTDGDVGELLSVCGECLQPRRRVLKQCPYCGHVNEPQARSAPEYVDGDLEELDPNVLAQMRGEIINVDTGQPTIPHGASGAIVGRKNREWGELCEAQRDLRDVMGYWGSVYHHGYGENDSAIQRRFYLTFGLDVLSAMALRRADAVKLANTIRGTLT